METKNKRCVTRDLIGCYLDAKSTVIEFGYADEIDWQDTSSLEGTTETDFLREAAWVVLSSGMRESVIRKKFKAITGAFLDWRNSALIVKNQHQCIENALKFFGHQKKINAIMEICQRIDFEGYDNFKIGITKSGVSSLQTLPYIGQITCFHLAKNIGIDVVKPDRHLVRMSESLGFTSPEQLCSQISEFVGDSLRVVDIVLWRFATIQPKYLEHFSFTKKCVKNITHPEFPMISKT